MAQPKPRDPFPGALRMIVLFLDDVASDVRYVLRGLIQKPGFTIAVLDSFQVAALHLRESGQPVSCSR